MDLDMIPVVDFGAYSLDVQSANVDQSQLKSLADQVCHAFTDIGFVYLKNHGIPKATIEQMFEVSKSFFCKPIETKQKYVRPVDANHGWVELEREKLNPDRPVADLKEAFNFQTIDQSSFLPNDVVPNFKETYTDFYNLCVDLTNRILDLMSMGLDIDHDFLRMCHRGMGKAGNSTTLRSLYYPPLTNGIKPGQVRCGEHSDYGSVTLLFQDDIGGLEVKPVGFDYVAAKPIPETVLVNLGDLMQRWTADRLVATKHRVLIPEEEMKRNQGRQSIAFFVHPDDEVMIECLDKSNKYEPISGIDYLNYRFSLTF